MKKIYYLAIPILLASVLMVGLFILSKKFPKPWRTELNRYLLSLEARRSERITVQLIEVASKPWEFTSMMSGSTWGETQHFFTDYGYDGIRRDDTGYKPLPYPPVTVWCVLLALEETQNGSTTGETTHTVVFVADHHDLYNASCVIHEPVKGTDLNLFMGDLSRIGCEEVRSQIMPDRTFRTLTTTWKPILTNH
jgi:hypothetical protein